MAIKTRSQESAIDKCGELAALVDRHTDGKQNGVHATAIAPLEFVRQSNCAIPIEGVTEPILAIVVQGKKEVLLNEEIYRYGIAQHLVISVDLPLSGFAVEAAPDQPFLGFKLSLDPAQYCSVKENKG